MGARLLILADGRFPAGGHAYSAGVESAVAFGDIVDVQTAERYLDGRIATSGMVDAAFAAKSCAAALDTQDPDQVISTFNELDVEYEARMPSPYLRANSRRLGRQMLNTAERIWTVPSIEALRQAPSGPHHPIALGPVVAAAGGSSADAAALTLHHLSAAVTSASVRLLGLDPIELTAVQSRAGHAADELCKQVDHWVACQPSELPANGGTLTEILGEHHGSLSARMFVA